ncbi:DUF2891 domain-containing protein [Actinoallomurus iriomotensis]|uniref:DUF2891 domain-containing protein n=1 Tax=Actinoallomurus iriomotensis TaxID=478107 RepID=A0A9W6VP22_9ACTN|nr:DUF2891 domain-containing protein [Actinoallomurus iriomotensis]GLY74364.1 hypothetical protein Airi01_026310 [Actinoallomurus iriomotensis]
MTTIGEVAARYARVAVRNIGTEFPHATQQVVRWPGAASRPRELHPAFHGAYDWHSCVHMHWLAVRLLSDQPGEVNPEQIRGTLDCTLTARAIEAEAAHLRSFPAFERPYGWAWAVALAAACERCPDPAARPWAAALRPLTDTIEELALGWLDRAVAPVRHGVHTNTAFALALLHESGTALGRDRLVATIGKRAADWYGDDRDYPASWEPSGQDFLSPALCEADLMRRVLPAEQFPGWLTGFLPGLDDGRPRALFTPAQVNDANDGHQAHLYGLNLSRAWQFRRLAAALPATDPRVGPLRESAARHLDASLPHVTGKGFVSDHWLATFAFLALTA